MHRLTTPTIAALFALAGATAAFAQATPTPPQSPPATGAQSGSGLGPPTTHPSQIDKGQNMILPSAGQSAPSADPSALPWVQWLALSLAAWLARVRQKPLTPRPKTPIGATPRRLMQVAAYSWAQSMGA